MRTPTTATRCAANRNPATFENLDTLDIGRGERSHLSSGQGTHYCLGASLEARIALWSLLDPFASIRLVAEPRYRDGMVLRGVESLPIEVERA